MDLISEVTIISTLILIQIYAIWNGLEHMFAVHILYLS